MHKTTPLILALVMAISPAFAAPWEVRVKEANPLDDNGKDSFVASGDYVSPIPGSGAAFPYEDLQARLYYECFPYYSNSPEVLSYYTRMAILFNEKPNVRQKVVGNKLLPEDFRLRGDSDETLSWFMADSHVRGFTFGARITGSFSSESFNSGHILPYDSVIVGVPWSNDGEVLFKFQVTEEMKAAITEIDGICNRLLGKDESKAESKDGKSKDGSKRKVPKPSGRQ